MTWGRMRYRLCFLRIDSHAWLPTLIVVAGFASVFAALQAFSTEVNTRARKPREALLGPGCGNASVAAYAERLQEAKASPFDARRLNEPAVVSKDTYMQWIVDSGHLSYINETDLHGEYGPRHFMPVLAHFVKTNDRRYGEACVRMLKTYHQWLQREVGKKGWHAHFCQEMPFIGLYERFLAQGGLLDRQKDDWFRELVLFMARTLRPWDSPDTRWRGQMHRAQGEGAALSIAANMYPNEPESAEWASYGAAVYGDFWRFHDTPANDTGYIFAALTPLFLRAELLGDTTFFTAPEMKPLWDRLLYEITPDGAVIPYGASDGWNSSGVSRILLLEMLAAHTGDGRYRYGAHKLMRYLRYQGDQYRSNGNLMAATEYVAASYLLADDAIVPVEPDSSSRLLYRKETIRLGSHQDKQTASRLLKPDQPLSESLGANYICCGLLVTDNELPSKLVLRSGWAPGDLFALIDLFPRHNPLNVPAVLGITRRGAPVTMVRSVKGISDDNRPIVASDDPALRTRINKDRTFGDGYYSTVTVPFLDDNLTATFAQISTLDYMGYPIEATRRVFFVKNRLLVIHDELLFQQAFRGKVTNGFNTRFVGPQVGRHWANTFIGRPRNLNTEFLAPAIDAVVFFLPQPGMNCLMAQRAVAETPTDNAPVHLTQVWQGNAAVGERVAFMTVIYPRPPTVAMDCPIEIVSGDQDGAIIRIVYSANRAAYLVMNPYGRPLKHSECATNGLAAYAETIHGTLGRATMIQGTSFTLATNTLHASDKKETFDRPAELPGSPQ
jgi:hypothetical protein